jgi:hypothetical protein
VEPGVGAGAGVLPEDDEGLKMLVNLGKLENPEGMAAAGGWSGG